MKAIMIFRRNPGESDAMATLSYRKCTQYAFHHGIMITDVFEVTDTTQADLLLYVAYVLANATSFPNALVAYNMDDIRTPENKDMFLPLIMAGMVELHLVQFRLHFDKNSQPELLERGGFKKLEEQGFWSELFKNYDLSLENGRP